MMKVLDNTACTLGEGAFWHPIRKQFFWFDIPNAKLYARSVDTAYCWSFDYMVSAAGWIDERKLLIASERALLCFDLVDGETIELVELEADNSLTRSNDGRADPWGGFWIGTMGKHAEKEAGAIYRFYKGELRRLFSDITISNAICFAPDKSCAYYTDTPTRKVMRQALDAESGWPKGDPELFLDLNEQGLNPDGAVTDSSGNLWIACWGDSSVRAFNPDAQEIARIAAPTDNISCPAFGGPEFNILYATSARSERAQALSEKQPAGQTFYTNTRYKGVAEPAVILE